MDEHIDFTITNINAMTENLKYIIRTATYKAEHTFSFEEIQRMSLIFFIVFKIIFVIVLFLEFSFG